MSDLATGKEILEHLLRRCGEILPRSTTSATADREIDAKLYVNEAHWWVCALQAWRWARKKPAFQFASVGKDEVSIVSIVGNVVTLAAPLSGSRAGRKLIVDSDGIPHRIATHATDTAVLTLVTAYTGTTMSGAGTIFQDEIDVATDILAWPHIVEVRTGAPLELIGEEQLRELAPANTRGIARGARYAAFITDSAIRIAPWTSEPRLFECAYNRRSAALDFSGGANDVPLVPQNFRGVIAWRAEAKLMADKRPEDKRGVTANDEVNNLLVTMRAAESGFSPPGRYVKRGQRISG